MLDLDPRLPTALLDFPGQDGGRQRWHFGQPIRWLVAHDPAQVPALLDDAHAQAQAGRWCLGWVAYEAAPAFDPHLPVKATAPGAVYAAWAIFDHAEPGWPEMPAADWHAGPWLRAWDDAALARQIEQIRELIRQGEVYQVNLTAPLEAPLQGARHGEAPANTATLHALFAALQRSQPQGYGLMLDARQVCRQPGAVLSVSPELFFDWDGTHITTRPMKGTAARGADEASDQAAAEHLKHSIKERAENLMIVDLLRNDLSRVADVGSVQVPSLFDVQALPTVWQMTSTITARTPPQTRLSEVFAALFPCGSVTGAPKRQAMHHIARLERTPRGVYCGAVGLMAPGGRVTFNVPIRTVSVSTPPPPAPWRVQCGIGSGITLDATPEGEIREWQHKQAFLRRAEHPFDLLESLRLHNGEWARLERHLSRLERCARHFHVATPASWPALAARIREALSTLAQQHPQGTFKVRLLVNGQGCVHAEAAPLPDTPPQPSVVVAQAPMPEPDEFIWHKTTRRAAYAPFKPPPGCLDTLLFNTQGEITEFTIGNVAVCLEGQWLTPPVHCGLLPGVMRDTLLSEGRLREAVITLDDLSRAQGLALINSVRGWIDVTLTR